MNRGYWGMAVYTPKNSINIGVLWRTAHILGASFLCTIGSRYHRQPADVTKAYRHVPLFNVSTFEDFRDWLPLNCQIVAVEMCPQARDLTNYVHPKQAVYLLGAEDNGIPEEILNKCKTVIQLKGERSLNMAVAGSIVAYHRAGLSEVSRG
jgi:tRNA G18 (ribose-2'-O)-methylase SpoU